MKLRRRDTLAMLLAGSLEAHAQSTPGANDKYLWRETPHWLLNIAADSGVLYGLAPRADSTFDFLPADRLSKRQGNGFHHLGDITLKVRTAGASEWISADTAAKRIPVSVQTGTGAVLAQSDLTDTLPTGFPIKITRAWLFERGQLVLRFTLKNTTTTPVEIGALGLPVVFNNIISDRNLEEAHAKCVFFDPYVGRDAGYLRVTRLTGLGPALAVIPDGATPFEGYSPLREPIWPNQTFEGVFEWLVHTKALAEGSWKNAQPWNLPTSATFAPGETRTYGLRFVLSSSIRGLEAEIRKAGLPVAVGVPGYIVPAGSEARLVLDSPWQVASVTVEPAEALTVMPGKTTPSGTRSYTITPKGWGRARLNVAYKNGRSQTVHYYVTKSAEETVGTLGNFLFSKMWFERPDDPFKRSPSVISYDRDADRQVDQDSRAWICGLGDEGGSSWLIAAMQLLLHPEASHVSQFERFVDGVLWGGLQYDSGPNKYGVRKSLFYYDPKVLPDFPYRKDLDWRSWTSWNKQVSEDIGRGYNYPHVVAAYWALYRLARNHVGLVKNHSWDWYLTQAFETTRFLFSRNERGQRRVGWVELGLMEGTIFQELLSDLKREGWTQQTAIVEALMKERTDRWRGEAFPFGSEMAWDSTGQEEVYAWCRYFGDHPKAQVSLNSIVGYMPTVPHWGYNGCARRYWDFLYGGKLSRIERQLHHYGSSLNALPVLTEFRDNPTDTYLLRIGHGGMMGPLSNIHQDGFPSVAFHSFPDTLRWDAYSGDYGPNMLGHALGVGCYVINDPALGWQAFGGAIQVRGKVVTVTPQDSYRQRVFLAPRKLYLVLDAGKFEKVEYHTGNQTVSLTLAPRTASTPAARLRVEGMAALQGTGLLERGGYTIPLSERSMVITLKAQSSG
ncbi:MAG: DUF5695 domain-containing protein [Armatimonas sp.]